MQKQAKAVKKKLANIHISAESNGVEVVVSAEQELISISIPDQLLAPDKKDLLQKSIVEAMKKAMKKAQEVAALEMKSVMGDLGFPGLGGE